MDASDRVSFGTCPSCGGPASVESLDADLVAVDCLNGCPLRTVQTPAVGAGRGRDTIAREGLVALFEQVILDTAATFGFTDPRKAAVLVADAWADVLREEGRSPRIVESATAAVREVGERMHRRQH